MSKYYTEGDTIVLSEQNEIIVELRRVEESVELHRHRFIEIAYVDSGEGVHEIAGGSVSRISKGDLVLFNSGVAHGYRVEPPDSLVIYNCLFDPAVLDASVSPSDDFIRIVYDFLLESSPVPGEEQKPYILLRGAEPVAGIIKDMFREYTEKQNGYAKINAANLTRLLITVFRLKRSTAESASGAYKGAIAESAVRYIKEFYAEDISCEKLAARAFVSTGYFHKIFKDVTGETPVEYIRSVRLTEAARLLQETGCSVRNAAEAVGYSDMKYFYEVFRNRFGCSPGEYKKTAGKAV